MCGCGKPSAIWTLPSAFNQGAPLLRAAQTADEKSPEVIQYERVPQAKADIRIVNRPNPYVNSMNPQIGDVIGVTEVDGFPRWIRRTA
jgi:hypothetical protein